jgi:heme exporter protein D
MPDLGEYAVNVLAAYGVGLAVLAVIISLSMVRAARVRRALAAEEAGRHG